MKRILLDLDVILDVLLDRRPHVRASAAVWAAVETRQAQGYSRPTQSQPFITWLERELGVAQATQMVDQVLGVFQVASVHESVIREALALSFTDFEDAVTVAAARAANCDRIVTRDPRGFRKSPVKALTTEAAVVWLSEPTDYPSGCHGRISVGGQNMTPTQQTTTPAQVIESVYAAFNRGDIAYIVSLVAPNATWRQPGTLPWGGDYTGPQGAMEFFSKLTATVRTHAFEPKETISAGNDVISFGDYEAASLTTGKTARARWAFRWRVEGGKIVSYDSYIDTAALLAAL